MASGLRGFSSINCKNPVRETSGRMQLGNKRKNPLREPGKKGRRAAGPLCFVCCLSRYVVERGLTAMAVAGTGSPAGTVVFVQPRSVLDEQAGRLGLICCLSVKVGTLM
jgi:hypothetical protein